MSYKQKTLDPWDTEDPQEHLIELEREREREREKIKLSPLETQLYSALKRAQGATTKHTRRQ